MPHRGQKVNGAAGNTAPTGAPTITGTAQVGETLTSVTTGIADADGLTTPNYTDQWIRVNGTEADIAGENSSTYTLVDADLGKTLKVRVTFDDDASNTETLTSEATAYDVIMNRKVGNGSMKRRPVSTRVPVTVRLPEDVIEQIDYQLDHRDIPLSRNNWLLEAAIEKLRRSDAEGLHGKK